MYRIKTLNKISPAGLSVLDQTRYTISTDVENEDGILVRSADMHDYAFPDALRAVARAGAGTNNIPIDRCSEAGIVVFNTPGANANAVKELAVCALLLASRKISDGVAWVKEQAAAGADVEQAVEKGKSQFVGPELSGKMLGVIGLGAIGVQVANIATKLGMTVFGYDPFLSVDGALSLSRLVHRAMDLETIYKNCDYITLHVPQTPETKGMFNEDAFHMMKGGVRILNLARGTLVNDDDRLAAQAGGTVKITLQDLRTVGDRETASQVLAEGTWNLKFQLKAGDLSVRLPVGQTLEWNGMTATIDALVVSPIGYYLRYTVDQQAEPVASGTGQMTQAQEEQWARFDLPHGLKRTDGTVLSLSDGTGSTGGSMAPQDGKEVCTRGGTFAQTIPVEEIAAFVVGGVEIPMP